MDYPSNELEAFGTGAMLDLRVRMAIKFIETSPMFHNALDLKVAEKDIAIIALNVATELMALAEAHGLVTPYDDSDTEVSDRLRAQAQRTAKYQVVQQSEGQRAMQNEQSGISRVMPMAPGFKPS